MFESMLAPAPAPSAAWPSAAAVGPTGSAAWISAADEWRLVDDAMLELAQAASTESFPLDVLEPERYIAEGDVVEHAEDRSARPDFGLTDLARTPAGPELAVVLQTID